jgi:hypothetical protein
MHDKKEDFLETRALSTPKAKQSKQASKALYTTIVTANLTRIML